MLREFWIYIPIIYVAWGNIIEFWSWVYIEIIYATWVLDLYSNNICCMRQYHWVLELSIYWKLLSLLLVSPFALLPFGSHQNLHHSESWMMGLERRHQKGYHLTVDGELQTRGLSSRTSSYKLRWELECTQSVQVKNCRLDQNTANLQKLPSITWE